MSMLLVGRAHRPDQSGSCGGKSGSEQIGAQPELSHRSPFCLTRCHSSIYPTQAASRASAACALRCSTQDAVRTARLPCLAARVQPPLYALPGVQAGAVWASARGVQPGKMSTPPFAHKLSLASAASVTCCYGKGTGLCTEWLASPPPVHCVIQTYLQRIGVMLRGRRAWRHAPLLSV